VLSSETVRQDGRTSQADAFRVQTYVSDMFAVYDSDTDVRDSPRHKTRTDWMDFLGAAYKVYFNPVLPKYSGKDTEQIKSAFCSKLRHFIFGQHSTLDYIPTGTAALVIIHLPNPKGKSALLICILLIASLLQQYWLI
jgi:hypothetical protein